MLPLLNKPALAVKEFKAEIIMERSITPIPEVIGWANNRMELHLHEPDIEGKIHSGYIIWGIEYDNEEDGDDDEWSIGLEFDGNKVTGYDGVMSISEFALDLLREAGYDVTEIE